MKKRTHRAHVAEQPKDPLEEDEEMEAEQDEGTGQEPGLEEEEEGDEEDRAFAAGWKAKQKVGEMKKNRGWKGPQPWPNWPLERRSRMRVCDQRNKASAVHFMEAMKDNARVVAPSHQIIA